MNIQLPKVIGTEDFVQLPNGKKTRIVLLNNAATTPPFEYTLQKVDEFLQTYGALHRGSGPHALKTCEIVEKAVLTIRRFLNLREDQTLLFTQNTSLAINWFARLLDLSADDIVITSVIEHTSNNLPWKYNTKAKVVYINAFNDGSLDYQDLENKVKEHVGRLKLITITGASNLTGYIPDIKRIANSAHANGALLFVDAAQLAPHRPIDMQREGIDALAFSAHKVYAPFGLGVLAVSKSLLQKNPVDPGGGSIDMISDDAVIWAKPELRHQTGTWNAVGIVALAASCEAILKVGWPVILEHEKELVLYAAKELSQIPGLTLYVEPQKYWLEDRIGTFPFDLQGYHWALLSAILDNEFGIETRAGTICNHRLVRRWFNVSDEAQKNIEKEIANGNLLASYGIVRASLGIYNTFADIDALINALKSLNKYENQYKPAPKEGVYLKQV